MYQNGAGLRQERAEAYKRAEMIHKRADAAARDLTDEERSQWETLMSEIGRLDKQISEAEERGEIARPWDRVTAGRFPVGNGDSFDTFRTFSDETSEGERHAFGPGESVFEHRCKTGWTDPEQARYEGLTLGAYLRAVFSGKATNEMERRALAEGTDSAGGYWVPEPTAARLVDKLRDVMSVTQAGARFVPMESESLTIARLDTDPSFSWTGEGSTGSATDPTFGSINLIPKTLRGIVRGSRELVQDAPNIEQAMERAFVGSMASELDRVSLVGSSTGGEPVGLSNSTAVNKANLNSSTAASAPTDYSDIVKAVVRLQEDNVRDSRVSAIMAPRTWGQYTRLTESTSVKQPLRRPPQIENVRFIPTNSVPTTQNMGGSTAASSIYVGSFNHLLIGNRLPARVEVLRERYADNYQFGFLGAMRADVGREYDGAFEVIERVST